MPVDQQILDDQYLYLTSNDSLVTVDNGYVQNYTQSDNLTISMNWMPSNNSSISYYVIDNQIIRYSGTIEISESISSYKIPIYHHIISPCICVIEIEIITDSSVLITERVLVNAKDTVNSENFNIVSISDTELITTEIYDFESAVLLPDDISAFNIKSVILNEKSDSCIHGSISKNVIDFENISASNDEYSIESIVNGKMNLQYNLSSFDDGWVSIFIGIGDENNSSDLIACMTTKIDLQAPIITIDAPIQIDEKIGFLIIDSSSTFDPHWGRDSLQYFWTYQQIDDHTLFQ